MPSALEEKRTQSPVSYVMERQLALFLHVSRQSVSMRVPGCESSTSAGPV